MFFFRRTVGQLISRTIAAGLAIFTAHWHWSPEQRCISFDETLHAFNDLRPKWGSSFFGASRLFQEHANLTLTMSGEASEWSW